MIDVVRMAVFGWKRADYIGWAAIIGITVFLYLLIQDGGKDCAVLCG